MYKKYFFIFFYYLKMTHQNKHCKTQNCGLCNKGNCANIIHPPCDREESYDSSSSGCCDNSCPDLDDIACDLSRKCTDLKDLCTTTSDTKTDTKTATKTDTKTATKSSKTCKTSKTSKSSSSTDCSGCGDHCNNCNKCKSCGCKECSDYSASSVASSLDVTSESCCPDLSGIQCDKSRHCDPLELCKDTKTQKKSLETKNKKVVNKKAHKAHKTFVITYGPKKNHPYSEYNNGTESIYVNGKNGAIVHMYRGETYKFVVKQDIKEGQEITKGFLLTTSPEGGPNSKIVKSAFPSIALGSFYFTATEDTHKFFFYNDIYNTHLGGLVLVH